MGTEYIDGKLEVDGKVHLTDDLEVDGTVSATMFQGALSGHATSANSANILSFTDTAGSSGNYTGKIWHIYDWEITLPYRGYAGLYAVVDTESDFNGILSVKFRNDNSSTSVQELSGVEWLAANEIPPEAVLTYTINSTSVTYHLYIKYKRSYSTLKIAKICGETNENGSEISINEQVYSTIGTLYSSSNTVQVESAKSATTANKLVTPRRFWLNGAIESVSSSFDGSGDVYTTVEEIKEAYLQWGGRSISGRVSPIDAAMSDVHRANRLAFADPDGITIEYSRDGGATYAPYETEDGDWAKVNLVSGLGYSYNIGGRSGDNSIDDKLRVTLNAIDMGVYCWAKKLLLYVTSSTNTASVTIEEATVAAPDTWITIGTYPVSGWSGWNSIPLLRVFGTNGADSTQKHLLRLTFGITELNADANFAFKLNQLILLADTAWTTPSEMARTGHLYGYNSSQRAIFPADVQAVTFHGALNGKANGAAAADTLFDTSMNAGFMKGSETQPVYFDNGVPIACTHSLNATVPANAKFTDTVFTGGNVSSHIYLTGAKENSSTSSTSQIVFGTASNNHVVLSSNTHALVINPSTSSTTNQIVLYLDKPSVFPSGIKANLTGNATTATTATKLGSATVGGPAHPIYLLEGIPTPCTYSLDLATTKVEGANVINTPGLVQSGGDVTITDGIITVNDDSHNHTIANVDGLQTELNELDTRITNIVAPTGAGWETVCEKKSLDVINGWSENSLNFGHAEDNIGYEYMIIAHTSISTFDAYGLASGMIYWPPYLSIADMQVSGPLYGTPVYAKAVSDNQSVITALHLPSLNAIIDDAGDLKVIFEFSAMQSVYEALTTRVFSIYRRKILY